MDNLYCANNNEPLICFDENIDKQKISLCQIHVQQGNQNLKTFEQNKDHDKQKIFDQLTSQFQKNIQSLQKLITDLNQYKNCIDLVLNSLITDLMQEIKIMEQHIQFKSQLSSNLIISDYQRLINDRDQLIKKKIVFQLKNLKQAIKIDQIKDSLQEFINQKKIQQTQLIEEVNYNYIKFEYQVQENSGKKQTDSCLAITFNQDYSLIFYGCDSLIKINKFENGCISNEVQVLDGHTNVITCLEYMNISNELVSASSDNSIIMWNKNEQGQWKIKQRLNEHKKLISCLVVNKKEDLVISGSDDQTIKFWQMKSQNWICQQSISTRFYVYGLSLDDQCNQLIACGSGCNIPEILVISIKNNKWLIKQAIKLQNYGLRLCFINSNMFVFQPNQSEQLEIFEIDKQLNQFVKTKNIQVKCGNSDGILFPCQFISSKEILFVKNNAYLNIIRRLDNGQFMTQQFIDFQTPYQQGKITQDGLFLVTWDDKTQEIYIRKLKYLKS